MTSPTRALLARAMSEAELQKGIIDLARVRGWRCTHFRAAMDASGRYSTPIQGDAGWPDLFLVRPPRVVALELKSARGKVADEQAAWLADLRASGVDARIIRPQDWLNGGVEALLA